MNRADTIEAILDRHKLSDCNRDHAKRLIALSLPELAEKRGDFVDFTGRTNVLVAAIEAREALASDGL